MARYTNNIVLDLEFTPIPKHARVGKFREEIIEIGAVRVDDKGRKLDSFDCLVKPSISGTVAPNVAALTGITDGMLRNADTLGVALAKFELWILAGSQPSQSTRIVCWSDYDRKVIREECEAKGILAPSCMSRWLDLQKVYPRMMNIGKPRGRMSLKDALGWDGSAFDANDAHRALYDAERTAELLSQLLTGEYLEHKKVLDVVHTAAQQSSPITANLGSRCAALADLYLAMTSSAAVCAA